jgi:hypothetical protein
MNGNIYVHDLCLYASLLWCMLRRLLNQRIWMTNCGGLRLRCTQLKDTPPHTSRFSSLLWCLKPQIVGCRISLRVNPNWVALRRPALPVRAALTSTLAIRTGRSSAYGAQYQASLHMQPTLIGNPRWFEPIMLVGSPPRRFLRRIETCNAKCNPGTHSVGTYKD